MGRGPPPMGPGGQMPQFAAPVQMEDGQWMGPVAEQMVPLNCPPGVKFVKSYLY